MIGDVPTGGPYTIRVAPADQPTAPARQFFHILVGDIWLLGGQSNMYGIDVVKEDLPALPWLNMLNVRHIDRAAPLVRGPPANPSHSRNASRLHAQEPVPGLLR